MCLIRQGIETKLYKAGRIPRTTYGRLVPAELSSSAPEHLRLGNATFHFSPAATWRSLPGDCEGAQASTDSHENIARAALRMERIPTRRPDCGRGRSVPAGPTQQRSSGCSAPTN